MFRNPQLSALLSQRPSIPQHCRQTMEFVPGNLQVCTIASLDDDLPAPVIVTKRRRRAAPVQRKRTVRSKVAQALDDNDTTVTPPKRPRVIVNKKIKTFSDYVDSIARQTGVNIDRTYAQVIPVIAEVLNANPQTVFLDCTSMLGYLATSLALQCPTVELLSIVDIHHETTIQRDFIKHAQRQQSVVLKKQDPLGYWNRTVYVVEKGFGPAAVPSVLATKPATPPVTHLYAHLEMKPRDELILAYFRLFQTMPSLQTMMFLCKKIAMSTMVSEYELQCTRIGFVRGDFGGEFFIYTLSRENFHRVHPVVSALPPITQVEDDNRHQEDYPVPTTPTFSFDEYPDENTSFLDLIDDFQ